MKLRALLLTIVGCLALSFAVIGCGGDDKSSDNASDSSSSAGGDDAKAGTEVSIKDTKFKPEDLTVKVGDTVSWTNDDLIPHTVTASNGADFDSGNMEPGKTFKWKADKAGKIDYLCSIHAGQSGTITVK